mgnify:FL=1
MQTNHPSLQQLLHIAGSKGHLSDDEDNQVPFRTIQWQGKRNNYFAQKRILELEASQGENLEQKFLKLGSERLGETLDDYLTDLRDYTLRSNLNMPKIDDTVKVTKRLKTHSLEVFADDYYYFSKKYMSVLKFTKRMVKQRYSSYSSTHQPHLLQLD